jgi:hypothetical protein
MIANRSWWRSHCPKLGSALALAIATLMTGCVDLFSDQDDCRGDDMIASWFASSINSEFFLNRESGPDWESGQYWSSEEGDSLALGWRLVRERVCPHNDLVPGYHFTLFTTSAEADCPTKSAGDFRVDARVLLGDDAQEVPLPASYDGEEDWVAYAWSGFEEVDLPDSAFSFTLEVKLEMDGVDSLDCFLGHIESMLLETGYSCPSPSMCDYDRQGE